MADYRKLAEEAAKTAALVFFDTICDQLIESGHAGGKPKAFANSSLESYGNYHQEHHIDRSYPPRDAITLIEQLHEFEDDGGLDHPEDWRELLDRLAAYTYAAAVSSMFKNIVEIINADFTVQKWACSTSDRSKELRDRVKILIDNPP